MAATPWALQPIPQSRYQSVIKPLGSATTAVPGLTTYQPTTSYTVNAALPTNRGYTSSGTSVSMQPASSGSRTSALSTLGNVSGTGGSQPSTASAPAPYTQRNPYSQPPSTQAGPSAGVTSPQRSGETLTRPGAYENWYTQNAGQYSKPTTLSSYWQSVQGRVQGQRFQPTTARDVYGQMQDAYSQPGQGMTNAYGVSDQLRNQSQGEGVMNAATSYFSGPNQTSEYYGNNRDFFGQAGDIENYYDANGQRFQQAGFGEQNAQDILSDPSLTDLYGNRLVGDEFNYFRDPLREKSYSEQLYESGNTGLNQHYDLQRQRQQEDLENQMSAMGVFGSGETVEAMYRMREGLAAEQSRDMAALAGQGDAERRARAGLAMDFSGAAADEELARGGLMLEGAGMGLQLDRDTISRLAAGGQLADASSRYGLGRVMGGGELARSADDSLFNQGAGLANIGRDMSAAELGRLTASGSLGLAADSEERSRLDSLFGAGEGVDRLGLDADRNELDWIMGGGQLAGDVDRTNLDWLNAGGGAADTMQGRQEGRIRGIYSDVSDLGGRMAGDFGESSRSNTKATAAEMQDAIDLIMEKWGLDATEAERVAGELEAAGKLGLILAGGK